MRDIDREITSVECDEYQIGSYNEIKGKLIVEQHLDMARGEQAV